MANWTASEEIMFHQSKTFMDYLHGDVERGDADLAFAYEYARESKGLWEAAKKRDELLREHPTWPREKVVLAIVSRNPMPGRPPWDWRFLMCRSFPTKDWNELSTGERKEISKRYETRPVPPLRVPDLLWTPQAGAMLDKFKELADANTPRIPNVPPGKEIPPMPIVPAMAQKDGSVYWCLFEVDFSESEDHLSGRFVQWFKQPAIGQLWREHKKQRSTTGGKPLRTRKVRRYGNAAYLCLFEVDLSARKGDLTKQFKKWLAVPENQKRLKRYAKEKRGKTGRSLDRLKDLAVWRLCREMPEKVKAWRHANEYADGHRKTKLVPVKKGERPIPTPRHFHDARATKERTATQAPLFSDASEASDAKRNALTYLAGLIPHERWIPMLHSALSWTRAGDLAEGDGISHFPAEFLRAAFHEIRRLDRERQRILCAARTGRHRLARHGEAA